jgi:hypothetical protein
MHINIWIGCQRFSHSRAKFTVLRAFGKSITRNKLHSILWSAARRLPARPARTNNFLRRREKSASPPSAKETAQSIAKESGRILCQHFSSLKESFRSVSNWARANLHCSRREGAPQLRAEKSWRLLGSLVKCARVVRCRFCFRPQNPAETDLTNSKKWSVRRATPSRLLLSWLAEVLWIYIILSRCTRKKWGRNAHAAIQI